MSAIYSVAANMITQQKVGNLRRTKLERVKRRKKCMCDPVIVRVNVLESDTECMLQVDCNKGK